jgi:hypothetical protein
MSILPTAIFDPLRAGILLWLSHLIALPRLDLNEGDGMGALNLAVFFQLLLSPFLLQLTWVVQDCVSIFIISLNYSFWVDLYLLLRTTIDSASVAGWVSFSFIDRRLATEWNKSEFPWIKLVLLLKTFGAWLALPFSRIYWIVFRPGASLFCENFWAATWLLCVL